MKLIFNVPGKYKSGTKVVAVTEDDVKKRNWIEIHDGNAQEIINAERAKIATKEPPTEKAKK